MDGKDKKSTRRAHRSDRSKIVLDKTVRVADKIAKNAQDLGLDRLSESRFSLSDDQIASDYAESSAAKIAREFAQSPSQRLATQISSSLGSSIGISPSPDVLDALSKALRPPLSFASEVSALRPLAIDHAKIVPPDIAYPALDASVVKSIQSFHPLKINSALGKAIQEAQSSLEKSMHSLGGFASVVKNLEQQQRSVQESLIASLAGPLGGIAKTGQWTSAIRQIDTPDIGKLLGGSIAAALGTLHADIARNFDEKIALDQAKMSAMFGLSRQFDPAFATTRLKMSALAGIADAFDVRSSIQIDAYQSLFGEWRSRPDLPENFWRDKRVRSRMYREADVDAGLIAAPPNLALEIMIDSGLASGLRSDATAVAVVTLGDVSMTVRSRGTTRDAFAALNRFEQALRAYVSRKLDERFGSDWFLARASNLVGKAKGIRKAAMGRGEPFAPLVDFIELGELSSIILSPKNWDEVFGSAFINRAEFDHDVQKLIALRRPTMHGRSIDGVRLVEMLCVMQRLTNQMADDGAWKTAAELDR